MSIGQVWMPLGKIWNMALSYKLNKIISMSLKLEPNARNDQLFVIIYILLKQSKTSKISLCISTSNFYFIIIGRGRAHGTHRESGERGGEREQTSLPGVWDYEILIIVYYVLNFHVSLSYRWRHDYYFLGFWLVAFSVLDHLSTPARVFSHACLNTWYNTGWHQPTNTDPRL